MSHELPLPPHLRQAQTALLAAGVPVEAVEHVRAALRLAADFYNATTHVSRSDQLRRDRNQIQAELELVSSELLAARQQLRALQTNVAELTQQLASAQQVAQRTAQQAVDVQASKYMSVLNRLREDPHELARTLLQGEGTPEQQLAVATAQLAHILAGSSHGKHRQLAARLLASPPSS